MMKTEQKLALIKEALDEMKAEDVVVIDASTRTIMADAFVVVTANSDTHARAMGDRLHLALKAAGLREDHLEMDSGREWTIVDLGDVVVHIFLEKARRYYNIEELWGKVSAAREKASEQPTPRPKDEAAPRARKISPGMERLAEETRAARGKRPSVPTYRSGAKLVRKGPSKGPDRGPSKGPDRDSGGGPDRGPSKGPDRGSSKGPDRGPSRGPDRGSSKGPDRGPSRGPDRGPSRGPDRGSSKGPDRGPSRGPDRGPAKPSGKAPAKRSAR